MLPRTGLRSGVDGHRASHAHAAVRDAVVWNCSGLCDPCLAEDDRDGLAVRESAPESHKPSDEQPVPLVDMIRIKRNFDKAPCRDRVRAEDDAGMPYSWKRYWAFTKY